MVGHDGLTTPCLPVVLAVGRDNVAPPDGLPEQVTRGDVQLIEVLGPARELRVDVAVCRSRPRDEVDDLVGGRRDDRQPLVDVRTVVVASRNQPLVDVAELVLSLKVDDVLHDDPELGAELGGKTGDGVLEGLAVDAHAGLGGVALLGGHTPGCANCAENIVVGQDHLGHELLFPVCYGTHLAGIVGYDTREPPARGRSLSVCTVYTPLDLIIQQ